MIQREMLLRVSASDNKTCSPGVRPEETFSRFGASSVAENFVARSLDKLPFNQPD
jgi:hypothetical protein